MKVHFGLHVEKLTSTISYQRRIIKHVLMSMSLILCVIVLTRPQLGMRTEKAKIQGFDLILVMDTSLSMLAEDIKPSRLVRAKYELSKLIDKLSGNRIGLVAFAGSAYLQSPLTIDHDALKMYLDIMDTNLIPTQGTAIAESLTVALEAFKRTIPDGDANPVTQSEKVIILLTDGEDHEEDPVIGARKANELGVKIYAIGIGSPDGAPIPITDETGQKQGFKKDKSGNIVVTKLNDLVLQNISTESGGKYYRAGSDSESDLNAILNDIATIEKREIESKLITEYDDKYQTILFVLFLCLVFEIILNDEKKGEVEWKGRF